MYSYDMGYSYYGDMFGLLFSPVIIFTTLALTVLLLVGYWKLFEKAGYAGWKCLIPFYNLYIMYEIALGKGKGWMFLLSLVPCVGLFVTCYFNIKLARAFGKETAFGVGLIFLPQIFLLILAFGSSSYHGAD